VHEGKLYNDNLISREEKAINKNPEYTCFNGGYGDEKSISSSRSKTFWNIFCEATDHP